MPSALVLYTVLVFIFVINSVHHKQKQRKYYKCTVFRKLVQVHLCIMSEMSTSMAALITVAVVSTSLTP